MAVVGETLPLLNPPDPELGGLQKSSTLVTSKGDGWVSYRNTIASWVAALGAAAVMFVMLTAAVVALTADDTANEEVRMLTAETISRFSPADDLMWAGRISALPSPIEEKTVRINCCARTPFDKVVV